LGLGSDVGAGLYYVGMVEQDSLSLRQFATNDTIKTWLQDKGRLLKEA
jgi:hypothetical protein